MHIVQGIIGMVIGFLMIVFRVRIKNFTGSIGFAERYLGVGGTWTFLLILGILLFVLSLMWATGAFQDFVLGRFGGIL